MRRSATRSATISWTRARVEHARQKRVIAAPLRRGPVDRREHRLDLGELQVLNRARAAFQGYGQDTLRVLDAVGVLCSAESEGGVNLSTSKSATERHRRSAMKRSSNTNVSR
jgi:hypothetical protein